MQVPVTAHVVSVDYNTFEAIRAVDGKEERAKLVAGDSTFAKCTWLDGTSWESKVPNLMLTVKKAPLRTKTRKKPAAAQVLKKPAAKKGVVEDSSDDVEEEGEEEETEEGDKEEELQEGEEEEVKEEDALVEDGQPKKKAKTEEDL